MTYKLNYPYSKYLPFMISVLLHSLILLSLNPFASPKIHDLIKPISIPQKPIHAVLIDQPKKVLIKAGENPNSPPANYQNKISINDFLNQQPISEKAQHKQLNENQRIISEYQVKVLKAIAAQWVALPDNTDRTLFCIYTINLAPNGVVISTELVQSSGNAALDHAAEMAIYRASPLPVPSDPVNFTPFRRFSLQLIPQQQS